MHVCTVPKKLWVAERRFSPLEKRREAAPVARGHSSRLRLQLTVGMFSSQGVEVARGHSSR